MKMSEKEVPNKEKLIKSAEIFKALGSITRLRILLELEKNPCNVKSIHQRLELRQSTVSQQLKILKMYGIVTGVKEGSMVCYQLSNQIVREVIRLVKK